MYHLALCKFARKDLFRLTKLFPPDLTASSHQCEFIRKHEHDTLILLLLFFGKECVVNKSRHLPEFCGSSQLGQIQPYLTAFALVGGPGIQTLGEGELLY